MWTLADSNRSPPECKTGALPNELRAQEFCRQIITQNNNFQNRLINLKY